MQRIEAENLAKEVISYLNPINWDGKGEKPKRFYDNLSYKISFWKCDIYVAPFFDKDDNDWRYAVELRDLETSKVLYKRTCYTIYDAGELTNIILDTDEWYRGPNAKGDNKQVCVLSVDVELQRDGKYDLFIGEDGSSGWHKENMTLEEIGQKVMDQIQCYTEAIDQ